MSLFDFLKKKKDPYQTQQWGMSSVADNNKALQSTSNPYRSASSFYNKQTYNTNSGSAQPQYGFTKMPEMKTQTRIPSAPTSTPQYNSANYMKYLQEQRPQQAAERANTRSQQQLQNYEMGVQNLENITGAANEKLMGQIPGLQKQFNAYQSGVQGGIDLRQQGTQRAIEGLQRNAAYDERTLAKAKKSQDIARMNKFAALGTLSSGGNMGYTGQQQQADEDLLVAKANNQAQLQDQIYSLELEQSQYENDALSLIQQESAKFQQAVRDIVADVNINDSQKQAYVTQLYQQLQQNVYGIQDTYDATIADIEQKKYDFYNAMQKAAGEGEQKYQQLEAEIGTAAQKLLSSDLLGAVSGIRSPLTLIPGNRRYDTKVELNNLKDKLQLRYAELLKGGGSISDAERRILGSASSVLSDPGLSEGALREELMRIASFYGGNASNDWRMKALQDAGFSNEDIQAYLEGQ